MDRAIQIILLLSLSFSSFAFTGQTASSDLPTLITRDAIDDFGGGVSSGLPTTGDYNCVGVGDIDEDGNIDIVIGAEENYASSGTKGLYAFFGSGDGVWTQHTIKDTGSYASIEIKDCDNDGNNEVWACYQEYTNGVGAWEWTGSAFTTSGISSPHTSGAVSYIRIANISGNNGLDMAVASQNGMRYYEGNGASPISWTQYSTGLSTNGFFTGMDVTDLNNDGRLDIAAGQYGDGILLYQQSSAGRSWIDFSSSLPSVENSGRILGLDSLRYQHLEDMIEAIGLPRSDLCLYCWTGEEV